jgi:hypothetical protein
VGLLDCGIVKAFFCTGVCGGCSIDEAVGITIDGNIDGGIGGVNREAVGVPGRNDEAVGIGGNLYKKIQVGTVAGWLPFPCSLIPV